MVSTHTIVVQLDEAFQRAQSESTTPKTRFTVVDGINALHTVYILQVKVNSITYMHIYI